MGKTVVRYQPLAFSQLFLNLSMASLHFSLRSREMGYMRSTCPVPEGYYHDFKNLTSQFKTPILKNEIIGTNN